MTTNSTNGGSPPASAPAVPPAPDALPSTALAVPAPATPLPAVPPSGDRVGDVMSRYHALMQHFLETQRAVMLTYLGAPRSVVDVRPAAAPPVTAPAALPPPPAAPPPAQAAATPPPAVEPAVAAAPEPTAAPVAQPPGNGHAVLSSEEIKDRLLVIVSERTGYPVDMLGLDADLEGDLGIDSIKRVEIAGTLTQSVALPEGALDLEELTASRTLGQVIALLEAALAPGAAPAGERSAGEIGQEPHAEASSAGEHRPFDDGPADEERIGRFLLQATSAPAITAAAGLAATGGVVIVDDETGVGEALADELCRRDHRTLLTTTEECVDQDALARLVERLRAEYGGAKALVHLAALGEDTPDAGLRSLLLLAKALRPDLETAASAGGAVVLSATHLGGEFGVGAIPDGSATQGAIAGFLKTLAQEWPEVRVRAVDLSAAMPEAAAEHLLHELTAAADPVEIGYRDGERRQLTLVPAELEGAEVDPLDADAVLLLTGGARGITAEAAVHLAERYRPTLVLVGRTPPGEEEEPDTAALSDLRDLRRVMIERRRRDGAEVTPALVEEDCRRLLRGREVRENLARVRDTGARVEYLSCDVRDADAFGALIEQIYARYGRIDGVIHGAGVIEDRLVRDKEPDSLERVMATKAASAQTLARLLRPDDLRFLVFFSSVSGRFGNRGQADYAAASEVINKLAQELDRHWPARVVSINWGPWRMPGGMVSPEVARQFASRGVVLIPVETGCRLLDEELRRGRKGEVEVLIGGSATAATPPLLASGTELSRSPEGELEALRRFDLGRDRFLGDHRVDGHPVLPFAVAMELMAEAAVVANSGLEVARLDGIRLLHGVTLDEEDGTAIEIRARRGQDTREAEVTIGAPGGGRGHYQARVSMRRPGAADNAEEAEGATSALSGLPPFGMSVEAAYRDLLFHGPLFQGIAAIEGMDERGAVSLLRTSDPGSCLDGAEGSDWLLDPVLLDSALQVQVVWARLHWNVTLLPAEIASYRRALSDPVPAGELVHHEVVLRADSAPPLCKMDHRFRLADGRLLATLGGVVGVGTAALNRLAGASA